METKAAKKKPSSSKKKKSLQASKKPKVKVEPIFADYLDTEEEEGTSRKRVHEIQIRKSKCPPNSIPLLEIDVKKTKNGQKSIDWLRNFEQYDSQTLFRALLSHLANGRTKETDAKGFYVRAVNLESSKSWEGHLRTIANWSKNSEAARNQAKAALWRTVKKAKGLKDFDTKKYTHRKVQEILFRPVFLDSRHPGLLLGSDCRSSSTHNDSKKTKREDEKEEEEKHIENKQIKTSYLNIKRANITNYGVVSGLVFYLYQIYPKDKDKEETKEIMYATSWKLFLETGRIQATSKKVTSQQHNKNSYNVVVLQRASVHIFLSTRYFPEDKGTTATTPTPGLESLPEMVQEINQKLIALQVQQELHREQAAKTATRDRQVVKEYLMAEEGLRGNVNAFLTCALKGYDEKGQVRPDGAALQKECFRNVLRRSEFARKLIQVKLARRKLTEQERASDGGKFVDDVPIPIEDWEAIAEDVLIRPVYNKNGVP